MFSDPLFDNFLLFTDSYQKQIYQMNLDDGSFHGIPLSGHENPISIDYDPLDEMLYWTDVSTRKIRRAHISGNSEAIVTLLPQGFTITFH